MELNEQIRIRAWMTGRWRECGDKIRFPSRKNARGRARCIGKGLHAYRCSVCRSWHIGHPRRLAA